MADRNVFQQQITPVKPKVLSKLARLSLECTKDFNKPKTTWTIINIIMKVISIDKIVATNWGIYAWR